MGFQPFAMFLENLLCENKGADQLHGNCASDQPPIFTYMQILPDSTVQSLLTSLIQNFSF